MFQEFFTRSLLLDWPLFGLVFFVLGFLAVLAYAGFGMRDRRRVARLAALPLEGDGTAITERNAG
jgi:cbb3-type cytochrome oxidase subunit 3